MLTQAQADRILGNSAHATIAQAGVDAAAKALGMTRADLQTALRAKSLLTLAQEKKVDVTALRTAIADAQKAAIDQAVKDGKLTQADQMKANLKPENIDLNRPFFFGWGGRDAPDGKGMPPGGMGAPPSGRMGRR